MCVCVSVASGEQEALAFRTKVPACFKLHSLVSHSFLSFLSYDKISSFESLELRGHAYN